MSTDELAQLPAKERDELIGQLQKEKKMPAKLKQAINRSSTDRCIPTVSTVKNQ